MEKILIIAPSWVGDCMLMQPMLHRLLQRYPGARIDVLAPPWTEKLLRKMPEIHDVINNPFPHGDFEFAARRRLGLQLRDAHYDKAIVLPNSWKSALVPFFANIPVRTGYVGEMRYGLLNDARKLNKKQLPLMVERFVQLTEAPGSETNLPLPHPQLQVSEAQRQQVLAKFDLTLDKPVAAFCPGAEYGPAKRWPTSYYAELAQLLRAQGYAVWLIGSPKDSQVAEKIIALGNEPCRNLCGVTDLAEAIALLACADLVVSNDSGLMHIAAALDRPMAAIFGSSSPQFTPPLSDQAQVLKLDLPCSPCFKRECPLGHFNCMIKIPPKEVLRHLPIHTKN
ncbi:MAG: lipopolysaccharide heptosyltransferase II [Gammaproteobacteria bacterium]|nr:lipopolysaccharide heptosyltransferase II [Gammaproteobacteria bacterium]MBU1480908.1 lipopolysaccharide heptosyltransferase II [Gammaproteobacteria bacterium]